jgi:hypothetical protein
MLNVSASVAVTGAPFESNRRPWCVSVLGTAADAIDAVPTIAAVVKAERIFRREPIFLMHSSSRGGLGTSRRSASPQDTEIAREWELRL